MCAPRLGAPGNWICSSCALPGFLLRELVEVHRLETTESTSGELGRPVAVSYRNSTFHQGCEVLTLEWFPNQGSSLETKNHPVQGISSASSAESVGEGWCRQSHVSLDVGVSNERLKNEAPAVF